MIRMVQIEYIKKLHLKEGKSIREIAKLLGHSRNTISKYLNQDVFTEPKYTKTKSKEAPVLDPVKPIIDQWLAEDEQMPKKQRHSGVRVYERLVEEYGFTGGCSTVRNYVYEKRKTPPQVFLPLEYKLGSNAQCDWGEAIAIINGTKTTIHLFCMKLSASGAPFVMAFPHQRQEAFFEGHSKAFDFYGGVPKSITYDNLKSAVKKVLTGHARIEQDNFIALKSHYLFDSVFCNVAKGNEKGLVEGLVGYCRRNFLVPIPEFKSFKDLNEYLIAKCTTYIQKAKRKGNQLVSELFTLEKDKLLSLPNSPFPCCRYIDSKVNSYSQIQFEGNRYSVPSKYAYQMVSIRAYVDYIEIYRDNTLIAKHDRSYDKGKEVCNLDHYLDQLMSKPMAINNASVLNDLKLPNTYQRLRSKILSSNDIDNKEYISILKLHKEYPSKYVNMAVELALNYSMYHFEGVRNLLNQILTPQIKHKPLDIKEDSMLAQVVVHKPQLQQYNYLLEGGCKA